MLSSKSTRIFIPASLFGKNHMILHDLCVYSPTQPFYCCHNLSQLPQSSISSRVDISVLAELTDSPTSLTESHTHTCHPCHTCHTCHTFDTCHLSCMPHCNISGIVDISIVAELSCNARQVTCCRMHSTTTGLVNSGVKTTPIFAWARRHCPGDHIVS